MLVPWVGQPGDLVPSVAEIIEKIQKSTIEEKKRAREYRFVIILIILVLCVAGANFGWEQHPCWKLRKGRAHRPLMRMPLPPLAAWSG